MAKKERKKEKGKASHMGNGRYLIETEDGEIRDFNVNELPDYRAALQRDIADLQERMDYLQEQLYKFDDWEEIINTNE